MRRTPRTRHALLLLHILSSVGWFGAVACFLALAIAGTSSADAQVVRGAYLTMGWADSVVLVPLAVASLVTGIVQSLLSAWGLLRHYWVVFKLVLTTLATLVLVAYTQTLGHYADLAASDLPIDQLRAPTVVVHSTTALVLLLLTTVLAVYKPRGVTPRGHRKRRRSRDAAMADPPGAEDASRSPS